MPKLFCLVILACLLSVDAAQARPIFGPKNFVRDRREPQEFTETFNKQVTAPGYQILIRNGAKDGSQRVSSASVSLNGVAILGPSDLNQNTGEVARKVNLSAQNQLKVRLAGAPGGLLTILVYAIMDDAGGTISTVGGAQLSLPAHALSGEVSVSLEERTASEVALTIPPGFTFLEALFVDLGEGTLTENADLAIPLSASSTGRVIVARVLDISSFRRLVLIDTASRSADGFLRTNSPPFPGALGSGTYVFLDMPSNFGIVGMTVKSATGQPAKGALMGVSLRSVSDQTAPNVIHQALASLATFVGQSDANGFAAVPGVPPQSTVIATAIHSPSGGPGTIGASELLVGDILSDGLLGSALQELIVGRLFRVEGIPDQPPQCDCVNLAVNPFTIPPSGGIFSPGQTQDLNVACSAEDVTKSDYPDLLDLLTTGAEANITGYRSTDAKVATVTNEGKVTAYAPGTADINVWSLAIQLVRTDPLVWPYFCVAEGAVHPVTVTCPGSAPTWNESQARCEARLTVQITGNGSVDSDPAGIAACRSNCAASFAPGSNVNLTAVPDAGWSFAGWSGACSGTTPTLTATVQQGAVCTAQFISRSTLSVTQTGNGKGSVTSSPAGINCGANCASLFGFRDVVTLTATASSDSVFTGWSGDCGGSSSSTTITITGDARCNANFDLRPFVISFTRATCTIVNNQRLSVDFAGTDSGPYGSWDLIVDMTVTRDGRIVLFAPYNTLFDTHRILYRRPAATRDWSGSGTYDVRVPEGTGPVVVELVGHTPFTQARTRINCTVP